MRTHYLTALLLTAGLGFSQASNNQPGGCTGCFSEPQSTLLFSGENGDLNYVSPSEEFIVPHLPNWVARNASRLLAVSRSGDRIAQGLTFMLNADLVNCKPSIKTWCDPQPRPIFKSVMGVYLVRDRKWEQYGGFERVGSAAFSPDGSKVAFYIEKGCAGVICEKGLVVLDIETGRITPVPAPGSQSVDWTTQLSWSPDGRFLTGSNYGHGYGQIVVIDVATGEVKTIAEGSDPSWSPKGDWIAYALTVQCMIVHPDGTGARSVLEKEHKWMSYTLDAPIVWSPDGNRLLLNQRQVDGTRTRVIMVDLATGHAVMKSKNGEVVMGWVPNSDK